MKNKIKIFIVLNILLFAGLALPKGVSAAPLDDGRTVFGESYTLSSGRILEGDLNVIGGIVEIEKDATVTGNVFIIGGTVTIDGTIEGDLTVIGGTVKLEEHALVEGNVFSQGTSYLTQAPGAIIEGEENQLGDLPWRQFHRNLIPMPRTTLPTQSRYLPILNWIGRLIGSTLLFMALGGLLLLVMPKSTEVMSQAMLKQPWLILGYGALTALVVVVASVIFAITICLAPLAILLNLVIGLAALFGWLTLGYELGKQIISGIFKTKWHPALTAVLGNLVLYLLARGLGLIPCLGGFLVFVVILFGLGAAVLTVFGTRAFPRSSEIGDTKQQVLFQDDRNEILDPKPGESPGNE
jgi:hypothetical protein